MGLPPEQARAAVRFSLSRYTSEAEIDAAIVALGEVVRTLRGARMAKG
jgi:cysteine sulfinate desulfinase/cysteine desulfurase-like protein